MRSMRLVFMFIIMAIVSIHFAAEAKAKPCGCPFGDVIKEKAQKKPVAPVGKKLKQLYVMEKCSDEQCYFTTIPQGWHAPKNKPQKDNVRQVYYLASYRTNPKMMSIVSVTPTEQDKIDFKEKVRQHCEAMAVKAGWEKSSCLESKQEIRQSMYAVCVATTKDCDKFECLGACYEPYPSKPPAKK